MEDLKTFIGVKMIQAKPMNYHQFLSEIKNVNEAVAKHEVYGEDKDGYLVVYPDGYKSWSPKDVFEKAYFQLDRDNVITKDDCERFIVKDNFTKVSPKSALVTYTTKTGFELNEISACVDPARFSEEIAMDVTKESAVDKLWSYLGFVLQWARSGITDAK